MSSGKTLTQKQKLYLALMPTIIGIVASTFYFYDFIIRVMPMAMTHQLMSSFHIDAGQLSIFFSSFFYGYALMQIPAGTLCDRIGARRLLTIGATICALATIGFSLTNNFTIAIIMRFTMGLTASIAYLGALWVGAHWLGSKRFAMYAGLVQVLGCMGAIIGSAPVAHLTRLYSWQHTALIIACIGAFIAGLNWLVIRDKPKQKKLIEHTNIALQEKFQLSEVLK
ncbi:MAG: MFS transporter, partial [Gammaproteobacteria bacterium]|nr:MFS transporter [Gammaproteobacteria bacterium]